jgi:hypothetical protein
LEKHPEVIKKRREKYRKKLAVTDLYLEDNVVLSMNM